VRLADVGRLLEALREQAGAAIPAKAAIPDPKTARNSANSGNSTGAVATNDSHKPHENELTSHRLIEGGEGVTVRDILLRLSEEEGAGPAVIHRLSDEDVAACTGESEKTLRAYVRGLRQQADLAAGIKPLEWNVAVNCRGCGPVWLWPTCPSEVIACPWCRHRKAGTRIPTPDPSLPT